jgi:hypothetical protein
MTAAYSSRSIYFGGRVVGPLLNGVGVAILLLFFCETLLAAPGPNQAAPTSSRTIGPALATSSGSANSSAPVNGSGAGNLQRTVPGQSLPQAGNFRSLLAGKTTPELADTCKAQLGGGVYSTGTDEIIVKIVHPVSLPGNGKQQRPLVESAFRNGIYLLSATGDRFIGLSSDTREINLGRLPVGELIFAIKTPEGNVFKTGPASRNPDQLEHAVTKTYVSLATELSRIEVWFEDLYGSKGQSDRDFNDAAIQLKGGVANNNAVADLLKTIAQEKGETRQQAIVALKELNPKAAAAAGFR